MAQTNILVTGASGQLGQLVVSHLLDLQATNKTFRLLAGTRSPAKLDSIKAKGVEVRALDFTDPSTFASAFAGVDRLILISTDTIGQRYVQHKAAIGAAVKAGIKHIVYTSIGGPSIDRPLYDEHYLTESYLTAATELGFTILRNGLYQEVLLTSLPAAIQHQGGNWISAAGNGKRSYTSRSDLALAAAHAATDKYQGDKERHIYDLGSSELFTTDEVAALAAQVTGKPVTHVHVTAAKKIEVLSNFIPADVAVAVTEIDVHTAQGFDNFVTGHFVKLVGHEPTPLKDFLVANKSALIGTATQ